jgi:hypothetical protein
VIEEDDVAVGGLDGFPPELEPGTRAKKSPGELEMGIPKPAGRAILVGIHRRRY